MPSAVLSDAADDSFADAAHYKSLREEEAVGVFFHVFSSRDDLLFDSWLFVVVEAFVDDEIGGFDYYCVCWDADAGF